MYDLLSSLEIRHLEFNKQTFYAMGFACPGDPSCFIPVYRFTDIDDLPDVFDDFYSMINNLQKLYCKRTEVSSAWIKGFTNP